MPYIRRSDATLWWQAEGDGPPLVLLNAIGTDTSLWDRTMPHLTSRFRVLRTDTRGHGRSEASPGSYSLGTLAADVATVMESADIPRGTIAGVSLGGMVALQLSLDRPEIVSAAVPICTGISFDPAVWAARIDAVTTNGLRAVVDGMLERFLSPDHLRSHPQDADAVRKMILGTTVEGYIGSAAAIRDMDLTGRLREINVATLVISGSTDTATPTAEHGQRVATAVPGARLLEIEAGHLAPLENPAGLALALTRFSYEALRSNGPIQGGSAGWATNRRTSRLPVRKARQPEPDSE